jgi:hypothetical protein
VDGKTIPTVRRGSLETSGRYGEAYAVELVKRQADDDGLFLSVSLVC